LTFTPFTVSVDDSELEDLRQRLGRTRWPDQLPGQEWVYGTERSELQDLCAYWAESYDWRRAEAELNRFPQVVTEIDGERVHLYHVPSDRPDAVPLLLTHGWPGSVVEFLHLIEPLSRPPEGEQAFHVVVPSLPGFGFSGPTRTTGVSPARIAGMWAQLMAGLGYQRYVAQGGDWGAIITSILGALDPEHCAAIHLNMVIAPPTPELLADATDEEKGRVAKMRHFQQEEAGYQGIQGTKPQTLAYALSDSPAGLCGWIYEKFRTWSDCDGDVFSVHDRDRFLTNVMLYWLPNTGGSAARIYYENRRHLSLPDRVPVPMGAADFPGEIYRAPRRFAEARYDVRSWSTFERGGHFAALERPDDLLGDLRQFVAGLGL
jgi:microsomal epoxide hydrolase